MAVLGYCRVSTVDQNLNAQKDSLEKAGCEFIYEDKVSGTRTKRPGLDACLKNLRPGDTLVVYRLDRLGRSITHLIEVVSGLAKRGVKFRSLSESIDTASAAGELMLHLFAAFAHFERALIVERTKEGLRAARKRGQHLGRPFRLSRQQVEHARSLMDAGKTAYEVGDLLGVSRSTVYRSISLYEQRKNIAAVE